MILVQMPADHYLYLASNFALGIAVGAYGTLVGAGGGFLLVPVFLLLHKLPHQVAVGTSLAVVMANALSGTLGYVRARKIDYRAGLIFMLCTFPGAVAGSLTVTLVSGSTFSRIFGIFLCFVALFLFFRRAPSHASRPVRKGWGWVPRKLSPESAPYSYYEPLGIAFSFVVGAVSSWFGIGGGIIHVPLMAGVLGFPVAIAVGTSHFILAFTALVGTTVHAWEGHVDLALALTVGIGAALGAQLGIRLSKIVAGNSVLRALALALLLVGVRLLMQP